jgi:tetratricopeptide (TPR) repeat protein
LIKEAIDLPDKPLLSKIALRFLQTPYEDSFQLITRLFDFVETISDTSIKLTLYDVIVKYARDHGIQKFLAKGLLQKYLIERYVFKRLEDTFHNGREILNYTDFLSHEEKVILYYRMSLHAYALKKYESCIELGRLGHHEDTTCNELKERVALAICNSYMFLGNFSALKEHLAIYEQLNYQFIIERLNYFRAIMLSRTGNYAEAIPLLRECLKEVSDGNRIHRVNELLEALFHVNDLQSIQEILETEEKKFCLLDNDPNQYSGLGKYYRFKGTFLLKNGSFDEGMKAYLQSFHYYAQINAFKEMAACSDDIYSYHLLHQKTMNLELLGKLQAIYNIINKKKETRDDEK